jgi:D-3-phosphoglycerate dehydrogenase
MGPKILITDKLHEKAVEEVRKFAEVDLDYGCKRDVLMEKISDYDALIVRSGTKVTREIIEKSNLKVIGRAGAGLDNIDVKAANEKGIEIVNSPESATHSVSELVFGSLLCLVRNILKGDRSLREGKWERAKFIGNELRGKTLGIIGFGNIGRDVAVKAKAFGMKLLTYDPLITEDVAEKFNAKMVDLNFLLENSDVITVHVPLIPETRNLLDAKRISKMKSSAIIVNMARGGVIDENALFNALKEEKIKGAALDVFEKEPPENSPLLTLNNVVLTPHLGASTYEAQEEAGLVVVKKIKKFFERI